MPIFNIYYIVSEIRKKSFENFVHYISDVIKTKEQLNQETEDFIKQLITFLLNDITSTLKTDEILDGNPESDSFDRGYRECRKEIIEKINSLR